MAFILIRFLNKYIPNILQWYSLMVWVQFNFIYFFCHLLIFKIFIFVYWFKNLKKNGYKSIIKCIKTTIKIHSLYFQAIKINF